MKKKLFILCLTLSVVICKAQIVKDIDGNIYNSIVIGSQIWLKENLKVKHYLNGDTIASTLPADFVDLNMYDPGSIKSKKNKIKIVSIEGKGKKRTTYYSTENINHTPKYQWSYDGVEGNVNSYGRLYTSYVTSDPRGLCPIHWHIPTNVEWETLFKFLGGDTIAGEKLIELEFSPYFSGLRDAYHDGSFNGLNNESIWWSSTEDLNRNKWLISYALSKKGVIRKCWGGLNAYAVKCLHD
jgi:uncharacterized protein (TIGR02145 family)